MHDIIELQIWQFLCVYLLLVIVLAIMKKYRIDKSKLLLAASIKMTVQLVLAGYILTYMFENPRLSFTAVYVFAMVAFTIHRVLSKNKTLGKSFKVIVGASITISGLFTVLYFIFVVIGISAFSPQYIIPISGMVMGNTMTGVSLGLKTFRETLKDQHARIEALTCAGVEPERILHPYCETGFGNGNFTHSQFHVGYGNCFPAGNDDGTDFIRHRTYNGNFVSNSHYDCHLYICCLFLLFCPVFRK